MAAHPAADPPILGTRFNLRHWLRCPRCRKALVPFDVRGGWSFIPVANMAVVEADVECSCGGMVRFHSREMTATAETE